MNLLLLLAIVVGGGNLVRQQLMLTALDSEHRQLAVRFGVLDVQNPANYLVTRIETDDPTHFLWRCYYPAGLTVGERCSFGPRSGSSGSSIFASAGEYLLRCHIDLSEESFMVHVMNRGGGLCTGGASPRYAAFLKDHWNELDIEVFAAEGTVELTTDQVMPFVMIRIPEYLRPELVKRAGKRYAKREPNQLIFQLVYGTKQAFQTFDALSEEDSP